MIQKLKKIAPASLVKWAKKLLGKEGPQTKDLFTKFYQNNTWNSGESISGQGSEILQTRTIISELPKLFEKYEIASILDIPCGDFNWMKNVDLTRVDYTGADIVDEMIAKNNKKYDQEFEVLDLTKDPLPKHDVAFIRDCFVHLPYSMIYKALNNLKASNIKYLITTTFTDRDQNDDIHIGSWRPLNLRQAPFNFPEPLVLINENCTEDDGAYSDKSLGLWKVSDLQIGS